MKHYDPNDRIVIGMHANGLGDALLYSTLTKLFKLHGNKQVYYTMNSQTMRNEEVAELIYSFDPYLDGFVDEEPNAGLPTHTQFLQNARFAESPIALVELLHGFRWPYYERRHVPMLHRTPKFKKEFKEFIVVDPFSNSQSFPAEVFDPFFRHLCFDPKRTIVLESAHDGNSGHASLQGIARYRVNSLLEKIDIIHSAHAFVGTESGSQSIAAAVRFDRKYVLCTQLSYNSRFFIFPGTHYTVTGALQPDYFPNGQALGPLRDDLR